MSGTLLCAALGSRLALEDELLITLGVDPYADTAWSSGRLPALVQQLEALADQWRREVEAAVLRLHRRAALEGWMAPLVERELAAAPMYGKLLQTLALARSAIASGAVLVFSAD